MISRPRTSCAGARTRSRRRSPSCCRSRWASPPPSAALPVERRAAEGRVVLRRGTRPRRRRPGCGGARRRGPHGAQRAPAHLRHMLRSLLSRRDEISGVLALLLPRVLARLHPRGGGRRPALPAHAVLGPCWLLGARCAGAGRRGGRGQGPVVVHTTAQPALQGVSLLA
jgi:hypothetical protein